MPATDGLGEKRLEKSKKSYKMGKLPDTELTHLVQGQFKAKRGSQCNLRDQGYKTFLPL